MTGIIFCHGWGLTPDFFTPLITELAEFKTICWDRGYYGDFHCPKPLEGDWIGIGHSQGFSHLVQSEFCFKGLIGLGTFTHFLGKAPSLRAKRIPILRAFQQEFKKSPKETIAEFRQKWGLKPIHTEPRYDRLQMDLLTLKNNPIESLPPIPIQIIGAMNDPVVPPELLFDNFDEKIVKIFPDGGHGLPAPLFNLTSEIRAFIQGL